MRVYLILIFIFFSFNSYSSSIILETKPVSPNIPVYLNDKFIGNTDSNGSLYIENVPSGYYEIKVVHPQYGTFKEYKNFSELTTFVQATFNVKSVGSKKAKNFAKILISCNISDADIFIDGEKKDRTSKDGQAILSVEEGDHSIKISKKGYKPYKERLNFLSNVDNLVEANLVKIAEKDKNSNFIMVFLVFSILILFAGMVIIIFYLVKQTDKTPKSLRGIFDQYELISIIGKGGMATIYSAKDLKTKELVALKILDIGFVNDSEIVRKFLREGDILEQIRNIAPFSPVVKVKKFGRERGLSNGRPFIAMELLKGKDLLEYIKEVKHLPIKNACEIIITLCDALIPAHNLGIFHRDLTPDNVILLTQAIKSKQFNNSTIRLIDFGIARHEYTSIGTLDGTIVGKPPYMSPEQCKGEKVDSRSDIYSLGILLYTIIFGEPPFVSTNPLEVMRMHEEEEVKFPSKIDYTIMEIMKRMLAKDKEERFQSLMQVKELLEMFIKG